MALLFSIIESERAVDSLSRWVCVWMIDCNQYNQSLRLFHEGGGMLFPVEEVCGDKGLLGKYSSCSLYLAFLIITHGALDFPQGHLQGNRSLRRGGVLTETGVMLSIKWGMWGEHLWTQSGYGICRTQGN
jgi:hypothetical protein